MLPPGGSVRPGGREIATNVKLNVERMGLVISRSQPGEVERLEEEIARTGLKVWGEIPYDSAIMDYDLEGKPLLELPAGSAAVQASTGLFRSLEL